MCDEIATARRFRCSRKRRDVMGGKVWRVAFAFDLKRQAILLVGGNKAGADQRRFYKRLISVADARFDQHLAEQQKAQKEHRHGKRA